MLLKNYDNKHLSTHLPVCRTLRLCVWHAALLLNIMWEFIIKWSCCSICTLCSVPQPSLLIAVVLDSYADCIWVACQITDVAIYGSWEERVMPWVLWHCWLGIRKSIGPVKIQWWGRAGVVICLDQGADCLHMVQLMPLHPKTLLSLVSFKSRLVLPFWYQVVLEKRLLKGCSSSNGSRSHS